MKTDAVAVRAPKALIFGAFHLTADGVTVKGKPEFGDWDSALAATDYLEIKSPFWKAELFAYAYTRADWKDLIDAVIDAGTYTLRTVDQYRYVAKNVPPEDRVEGLSFSHHEAVASLPSGDKRIFLKKAKTEHLSVAELKAAVRKVRHTKILRGQASELAKAQDRVALYAENAIEACKAITRDDCKKAEKSIAAARRALDDCANAVVVFRKAIGIKK